MGVYETEGRSRALARSKGVVSVRLDGTEVRKPRTPPDAGGFKGQRPALGWSLA